VAAEAIAKVLLGIRKWERQNMPMPTSAIAGEILYFVASRSQSQLAQVKEVHLSLGYSEARVSEILQALLNDGWLKQELGKSDKRIRYLSAPRSTKMLLLSAFHFEMLNAVEAVQKQRAAGASD
jgi:DNA-binding IclR family transcriptional regulator